MYNLNSRYKILLLQYLTGYDYVELYLHYPIRLHGVVLS
jgi:hypothetical protein